MQDFLQGFGVFACIAGIVLIALVALAARAFSNRGGTTRGTGPMSEDDRVFNERGRERPTYDSQRVESSGGFGGVPSTGASTRRESNRARTFDEIEGEVDREDDLDPTRRSTLSRADDQWGERDVDTPDRPRRRDRDDDDVRSSGGFGG